MAIQIRFDWTDLQTFLSVARCASFGKAASDLGITQPTVSRRIASLEAQIGRKLMRRYQAGIELTEDGRELLEIAEHMETSSARIANRFARKADGIDGRITLSAPDGLLAFWIMPRLDAFLRANPHIKLNIDCSSSEQSADLSPADISVQFQEPTHPDSIRRPIAWVHFCYFAAQSYLKTYGHPKNLNELPAHRTVLFDGHVNQPERWHPKSDAVSSLIVGEIRANSSAVTLSAIRSGLGIGTAPSALAAIAPDLTPLDLEPAASLRLWLSYRLESERNPAFRPVVDALTQLFDPRTYPWFQENFVPPQTFFGIETHQETTPVGIADPSIRKAV